MKSHSIHQASGQRTFALIFDVGDEVVSTLTQFAVDQGLEFAHFTAIGAFRDVTLEYFDWERRDYVQIPVNERVEVLSLMGDIADAAGEPKVHAHVTLAKRDGRRTAGISWKRTSVLHSKSC